MHFINHLLTKGSPRHGSLALPAGPFDRLPGLAYTFSAVRDTFANAVGGARHAGCQESSDRVLLDCAPYPESP